MLLIRHALKCIYCTIAPLIQPELCQLSRVHLNCRSTGSPNCLDPIPLWCHSSFFFNCAVYMNFKGIQRETGWPISVTLYHPRFHVAMTTNLGVQVSEASVTRHRDLFCFTAVDRQAEICRFLRVERTEVER